jgi:hypothetical protein
LTRTNIIVLVKGWRGAAGGNGNLNSLRGSWIPVVKFWKPSFLGIFYTSDASMGNRRGIHWAVFPKVKGDGWIEDDWMEVFLWRQQQPLISFYILWERKTAYLVRSLRTMEFFIFIFGKKNTA